MLNIAAEYNTSLTIFEDVGFICTLFRPFLVNNRFFAQDISILLAR